MLEKVFDVFFPRNIKCVACNKELFNNKSGLCKSCLNKVGIISGCTCMYCGKPIEDEVAICISCEKKRFFFKRGYSILSYNDFNKKLILQYKYHRKTYLAYYFAKMIFYQLRDQLRDVAYVTYVPLHKTKLKKRGFNQSEILANYLAGFLKIKTYKILNKVKPTKSLKNLNKYQREVEIRGSFEIAKEVAAHKILLVDDVFTTGATLNECSKVIYEQLLCDIITVTIMSGRLNR